MDDCKEFSCGFNASSNYIDSILDDKAEKYGENTFGFDGLMFECLCEWLITTLCFVWCVKERGNKRLCQRFFPKHLHFVNSVCKAMHPLPRLIWFANEAGAVFNIPAIFIKRHSKEKGWGVGGSLTV